MKIGICSGSLFKEFKNDADKYVKFCRNHRIKHLEFTFKLFSELKEFSLSPESEEYLKNCELVSIHFPFKEKVSAENQENIHIIENIYKKYRMNNITIHPNMIEQIELLDLKNIKYSVENIKPKKEYDFDKIDKILKLNPSLGFVLDTTHAFHYSETKVIQLYELFADRLRFIHFSDMNHAFFKDSFGARKEILKQIIKLAKENKIPLMIETENFDIKENLEEFELISGFQ